MTILEYNDFDLRFTRDGAGYRANVLHAPAGEAQHYFELPFSRDRLDLLLLQIGMRPRADTRRVYSPQMAAIREVGSTLFDSVFSNEIRVCFRSSLERLPPETGMRIKLRLQEAPELLGLPWELLLDSSLNCFIGKSNRTPIVRYIEMPQRIRPLAIKLPLNILVMVSSPKDMHQLQVGHESDLLRQVFSHQIQAGRVSITVLPKASLRALQQELRRGQYHVFHYVGHGAFDSASQEGVLMLEDENGFSRRTSALQLGTLLHDHQSLRLAVLNACDGARSSLTDPYAGVATTLIQQGIPAVVAMQHEITESAALTFAEEFYVSLSDGLPVDTAVTEARKAIYALPNESEWMTPVLYMRANNGVLFTVGRPDGQQRKNHAGLQVPTYRARASTPMVVPTDLHRHDRPQRISPTLPNNTDPSGHAVLPGRPSTTGNSGNPASATGQPDRGAIGVQKKTEASLWAKRILWLAIEAGVALYVLYQVL